MTVSMALRNHPKISEATRLMIIEKAEELRYRPDPALSALHVYRHSNQADRIHSSIAWLNTWSDPDSLFSYKEFREYIRGAKDHAESLGYSLEEFRLKDMSLQRFDSILKARNIKGVLIAPGSQNGTTFSQIDWSDYAVVKFGKTESHLTADTVCSAQTANTYMAFNKIKKLGYKRIGFIGSIKRRKDYISGYRWGQSTSEEDYRIPPLGIDRYIDQLDEFTDDRFKDELNAWLQSYAPDAILTDAAKLPSLLESLGYRIPQDVALATTSIHDTPIDSGINQRPYDIGVAAARMLTYQIIENTVGSPEHPMEMLIRGLWVDGSMMPKVGTRKSSEDPRPRDACVE